MTSLAPSCPAYQDSTPRSAALHSKLIITIKEEGKYFTSVAMGIQGCHSLARTVVQQQNWLPGAHPNGTPGMLGKHAEFPLALDHSCKHSVKTFLGELLQHHNAVFSSR